MNTFQNILSNILGSNWEFSNVLKDDSDIFICLFNSKDPESIPDKMAAGINKHTGKTAFNHLSLDQIEKDLR